MNKIINTTDRTASTIAAEIRILDRQAANTCLQYIIALFNGLLQFPGRHTLDVMFFGKILQIFLWHLQQGQSFGIRQFTKRFAFCERAKHGTLAGAISLVKAHIILGGASFVVQLCFDIIQPLSIFNQRFRLDQPSTNLDDIIEEKNTAVQALDESVQQVEKLKETIDAQNAAAQSLNESLQEVTKLKEENDDLNEELELLDKKIENMEKAATEMGDKLTAKDQEIEKLKADVAAANKKAADAKADLKKAKENPDIPAAMMEQLRAEAETSATEKAAAEVQKKLEDASRERAAIEDELTRTQQKLDAAQKAAKLQNPAAAVFKVLYKQVQEDFQELYKSLLDVQQADPALGAKLRTAVESLLSKLTSDLED